MANYYEHLTSERKGPAHYWAIGVRYIADKIALLDKILSIDIQIIG